MIAVKISRDNFIYDVHSIVKAFYPTEEIKVFVDGEKDIHSEDAPEIEIKYLEEDFKLYG